MGFFDKFSKEPDVWELERNNDVKGLIKAIDYKDESIQCDAILLIKQRGGDRRALKPLINALLKDKSARVREDAARALDIIPDESAIEPLSKAMIEDKDGVVRKAAAYSIFSIDDNRIIEPLSKAVEDEDERVRKNALLSLSNVIHAQRSSSNMAYEALINSLESQYADVKYESLGLINGLRFKYLEIKAIKPMIKLLKDDDDSVRSKSCSILSYLSSKGAEEKLNDLYEPIMDTLKNEAVIPLIDTLNDEDENVRKYAVSALGHIGDKRAVDPITNLLQKEKDKYVRNQAERALTSLMEE